jgi:epoxyqueuosine reductase
MAGVVALPHREESRDANRFAEWVSAGHAGSMQYLSRVDDSGGLVRARVATPFPWARSAIVCFASYHGDAPLSTGTHERRTGWIARYAWSSRVDAKGERRPSDYHKVLLKRLKTLDAKLREQFGAFESRAYVDTGPVVERSLATAAGLGWTGKNTCLIHPKLGSFGFLAVLLTSLDVSPEEKIAELVPDRCGTCTRCLEACPTGALTAPYKMDATRCIAYLTIEHKGTIAPDMMEGMGRQVFGCDICQDVCPWNRKAPVGGREGMQARQELINPALEWLAAMDGREFKRRFKGSPLERTGRKRLLRNVAIAMGNSGEERFVGQLEAWRQAEDPVLAETAEWGLRRIVGRGPS